MRKVILIASLLAAFCLANTLSAQDNSSAMTYEAYQAGKAKASEKQYAEAIELFMEAIEVGDPEKEYDAKIISASRQGIAAAQLNQGTQYRNDKDYQSALESYIAAMEIAEEAGNEKIMNIATANGTRVAYVLGNNLKKAEDFEAALEAFQKGISLDTVFYKNYIGEAQVLEEQGKVAASVKAYLKAGELCGVSDEAEVAEKAEKMYSKAENMIAVAGSNDEWEVVEAASKAYLEERDPNAEIHYYLSKAKQGQNQLNEAMAHADKAIEMAADAMDDKYYMRKAEVLEAQGKTQEAIDAYKKVSDAKYKERADYKVNELEGGK